MKYFVLLLAFSMVKIAPAQITARAIVSKAQSSLKIKGFESVSTMTIVDGKGRERVRKIAQVSKLYDGGDLEKRLVRFLAPADVKGTSLLTFDYEDKDDDIMLYMPALRKTRRIVSSEKSKNFMGSEFSYADMSPPSLDDFSFNQVDDAEVRGVLCYKVEWIPNDEDIAEENGFSKRISFISKENFVVRKAVYYDLDEEIHKELNIYEVREIDPENHKFRAMHLEMVNLQNDRKSIFKLDQIKFNPNVKDDFFTTRYLERE